ncbi:MAG: chromate resistance protein ChrB domain-containing protein [Ktedonobacteraceae bacterium]
MDDSHQRWLTFRPIRAYVGHYRWSTGDSDAALTHIKECSFEVILKKLHLTSDPALILLGTIVNGADTDNTLWLQPEGAGLKAIAEGFSHRGYQDDQAPNAAPWIVYDALYAYCQKMIL